MRAERRGLGGVEAMARPAGTPGGDLLVTDPRSCARRRTHRTVARPVRNAVGPLVPPLLVAGVAVVVVKRLTRDSGGELNAIWLLPLPQPIRPGERRRDHEGGGEQGGGIGGAHGHDSERDEKPSTTHVPTATEYVTGCAQEPSRTSWFMTGSQAS